MANSRRSVHSHSIFKPLSDITLITEKGESKIPADSVQLEHVGEKALGLSCLPKAWTLPFIVVSEKLFKSWAHSAEHSREQFIKFWVKQIFKSAISVGIEDVSQIIVRSSGHIEGLGERGMFYSTVGTLDNIIQPLTDCLQKLSSDKDLTKQKVPLIVQKCLDPISAKGHLSNERRCYKEKRDWLGEFEELRTGRGKPFQINLRNWRKQISVKGSIDQPLWCKLSAHVSEVLKIPAAWAYEKKLRLHYEWVWDGEAIYLVQSDQERESIGVEPNEVSKLPRNYPSKFKPKCLTEINETHANKYFKIRNVFTYLKLDLPITKIYALDNQAMIRELASGKVHPSLKSDLFELVKGSLVIRMDIATDDINKCQLLPRSDEVRGLVQAEEWLKEKSAAIKGYGINVDVVFIFHNFVPAASSAFAYAAPGERQVQIEALWGLPEGIYYNKHDKFVVDTQTPRLETIRHDNIKRFAIKEKINFKHFFVAPDEEGHWTTKILKPPYDWRRSIRRSDWIKELSFHSRRIAEEEGKPLSIMWFVGVPRWACSMPIIPWYHEVYDLTLSSRAPTHRTKTPFDRSLVIKTSEDIEILRREAGKEHSSIRRVRIQPSEEKLLRNKDTLRTIGELTKKIGAVILMEGGVLSHAYYQLMETKAIVEVLHPFEDFKDKREFNKLVRDRVPSNIEQGGEIVSKTRLSGEHLLRALREKLIEEAFEVLDAVDQDSIVGELVDVVEIVDGVLSQLGVDHAELIKRQRQKRERAGGFKDGLVLLETEKPLPIKAVVANDKLFANFVPKEKREKLETDSRNMIGLSHSIEKWRDRREHKAASESILNLVIPMIRDSWEANTPEKIIELSSDNDVRVKVKITGKRLGAKVQLGLSIYIPQRQLKLF